MAFLLDAPGYDELSEPGYSLRLTGNELFEKGLVSPADTAVSFGWWNPPGSQWLTTRPWQFDGDWNRNVRLNDHVVYASGLSGRTGGWSFASNLVGLEEIGLHDRPGATYPDDKWLSWYADDLPAGNPAINFAGLASACSVDFPGDIAIAALSAREFPNNVGCYMQWAVWPRPNDLFCYGFGNLAIVSWNDRTYLCRTPDGSGLSWELMGSSTGFTAKARRPNETLFSTSTEAITTRGLMALPVGFTDLYMMSGPDTAPWVVPINTQIGVALGDREVIKTGRWWVAGYAGQKTVMQAQTIAWRDAAHIVLSTGGIDGTTSKAFWNLGQSYLPDADPVYSYRNLTHNIAGEESVITPITSGYTHEVASTGEFFAMQLVDEEHDVWDSDGTHFKGAIRLEINAANTTAYLREYAPQLREVILSFPVVLEAGPSSSVQLTDEMFNWEAGFHLNDPEAKELTLKLNTRGAAALRASGLEDRHDYAIQLKEDADANGSYETLRAAWWLNRAPEYEQLKYETGEFTEFCTLHAKGILLRLDANWEYTTEILDTANLGELGHYSALRETLRQAGFDVDDTSKVDISTDNAPGDTVLLPGTANTEVGEAGKPKSSAYAPDDEESKLEYALRMRDWNHWLLYENAAGKVFYHYNPIEGIIDVGGTLTTVATFYQTSAAAVSAGRSRRQKYERASEEIVRRVESNFIRVTPSDPDLPQKIIPDHDSISNPASENYVGRKVRPLTLRSKLAKTDAACNHIAVRGLRRLRRRVKERHWTCKLAPWQVGPSGVEVGSIVALQNISGQFQIVSMEPKSISPTLIETTFVGWKVPTGPVFVAP